MKRKRRVAICGAGIAGVSAAYFLTRAGITDVVLIDERPPLSLTSDRSTECYRNWWPDSAMLALTNRSIDLMEELAAAHADVFRMNRRGYLYLTANSATAEAMAGQAARISAAGGGALRIHEAEARAYQPGPTNVLTGAPDGADLLIGTAAVRKHFDYVADNTCAALHVRRAGWLSAQQLGMLLLELGRAAGVQFLSARLVGLDFHEARGWTVALENGEAIECESFVNAAGPFCQSVGALAGLVLPLQAEVHLKVAFEDHLRVLPRGAPLLIWNDPQSLAWGADELAMFDSDSEDAWLKDVFPAGAHTRPEGGSESSTILMLWDYRTNVMEPVVPVPLDEMYPEIVLRGLSRMLPGLTAYFGRSTRPQVDGGYYVRTPENRPLIGSTPNRGMYVIGALSGFGIMSACAAGELLAAYVGGKPLPAYAPDFALARYDDPSYADSMRRLDLTGEL